MAEQTEVRWLTCELDGCIGIRLTHAQTCLAHASEEETSAALKLIRRTGKIDARGVPITRALPRTDSHRCPPREGWTTGNQGLPVRQGNLHRRRLVRRRERSEFHQQRPVQRRDLQRARRVQQRELRLGCRVRGATFSGDAWFSDATFKEVAGFREANFTRVAGFGGATFTRDAWFSRTSFNHNAQFNGAAFGGVAGFEDTTFSVAPLFENAAFSGIAVFDGTSFNGGARFTKATFSNVQFRGAELSGNAWFDRATFDGYVKSRLSVARFSGASGSAQRARPPGEVGERGLDEAGANVPGVAQLVAVAGAGAAPAVSLAVTRGLASQARSASHRDAPGGALSRRHGE